MILADADDFTAYYRNNMLSTSFSQGRYDRIERDSDLFRLHYNAYAVDIAREVDVVKHVNWTRHTAVLIQRHISSMTEEEKERSIMKHFLIHCFSGHVRAIIQRKMFEPKPCIPSPIPLSRNAQRLVSMFLLICLIAGMFYVIVTYIQTAAPAVSTLFVYALFSTLLEDQLLIRPLSIWIDSVILVHGQASGRVSR